MIRQCIRRHNALWREQAVQIRRASQFSLKSKKSILTAKQNESVHPTTPARTRFAPSPTGFLHIGSLRTALYNYLLARNTGGQFLLRLEDTDQKRLVPGAERNIYDSLNWTGLHWDEGPLVGGPYGPYVQSKRSDIYSQYSQRLLDSNQAYRCFCSKDRLTALAESARKLHPPSLASYDRKCSHLSREESDSRAADGESFTIRLKAPASYPQFDDLLHGHLDLQPQINYSDLRYDDPVLVKSDGLPTYHFANVIDDHLMRITHVIRGEEWLSSTPKHMALYSALGWEPPKFVHIPLLTSLSDQKLSKRSGDIGILSMRDSGILPEAIVNFVALFGWSPPRPTMGVTVTEVLSLEDLVSQFSLDGLTKGNAKVDNKKLLYFNSHFFKQRLTQPETFDSIVDTCYEQAESARQDTASDIPEQRRNDKAYTRAILKAYGTGLSSTGDFAQRSRYFYTVPEASPVSSLDRLHPRPVSVGICKEALRLSDSGISVDELLKLHPEWSTRQVLTTLRYAVAGGMAGVSVPKIIDLLGVKVTEQRLSSALSRLESN